MEGKLSSSESEIHEITKKLKKAESEIQEMTEKLKKAELEIQTLGQQLVTPIRKTKVFLHAGQMAELEARRAEILGSAAREIQQCGRTHIARREFISFRNAAILIQSCCRGILARKVHQELRRQASAFKIQKNFRRYVTRKSYGRLRLAAITVQTGLRAMDARNKCRFRKETKAAIIIQARARRHMAYSDHKRLQKAALVTQCGWRQRIARKELTSLKMAAREPGALKEAKDKLEKRVEELTWCLQYECQLRKNFEEEKSQEVAKLLEAMQDMKLQLEESNSCRINEEREAAKKAIEEGPPLVKGVPVMVEDTEKDLLQREKEAAEEARKAFLNIEEKNLELVKKLEGSDDKIRDMTEKLKKAESEIHEMTEKLRKAESEIKALRQQTLTMTPIVKSAPRSPENSHAQNGEAKRSLTPVTPIDEDSSEDKPQRSHYENQQDLLISCISQNLGYSKGKPVAAFVIYKCLIHWRSFEVERTSIFDRIIQTIGSAVEVQDNSDKFAYWLSNTSSLLLLLQQPLKATGAAGFTPQRRHPMSASLFGRMSSLRASPQSPGLSFLNGRPNKADDVRQVTAKYPALLFKQQLTDFLKNMYGMIRDNLKKEISPLLTLCIQSPRTLQASLMKGRTANSRSQQGLIVHWQSIVKSLNSYLTMMKANNVPAFLVRKVYSQIFSFVNVELFNSLLLRRECCSFINGEYVKAGLEELEQWCYDASEEGKYTSKLL